MSSTELVVSVLKLGHKLNDAEFRLLINLAECPSGYRFLASHKWLAKQCNWTISKVENIAYGLKWSNKSAKSVFSVETHRGIKDDMTNEYVSLELV